MNLSLVFLHGEQALVSIGLAALIALFGIPLGLYIWLWHTKLSELKLALGYFIFAIVLCFVFAFSANNPPTVLALTPPALGFIITLPWNLLASWAMSTILSSDLNDRHFAVAMAFGAGANAMLLYLAARKMRRLIR